MDIGVLTVHSTSYRHKDAEYCVKLTVELNVYDKIIWERSYSLTRSVSIGVISFWPHHTGLCNVQLGSHKADSQDIETQHALLQQYDRWNDRKWPWTLQGQMYPIYVLLVPLSLKFHTVLLYDQLLPNKLQAILRQVHRMTPKWRALQSQRYPIYVLLRSLTQICFGLRPTVLE